VRYVRSHSALVPEVVIVLGSGLGAIADELEGAVAIPYADIPHFHAPGVAGHPGRLVLGRLKGVPAAVMQGWVVFFLRGGWSSLAAGVHVLFIQPSETANQPDQSQPTDQL
jgi:purine nucleoside phosphorylase